MGVGCVMGGGRSGGWVCNGGGGEVGVGCVMGGGKWGLGV